MIAQKYHLTPRGAPQGILILVLALSVVVFCAGLYLARKTETVALPIEAKPLQSVGNALARETRKLEHLLESDLRQLVQSTESLSGDTIHVQIQCNAIVGVEQWSLVHGNRQTGDDVNLSVDSRSKKTWPKPTFEANPEAKPNEEILLSQTDFLSTQSQKWGWINDPGKPLLFWQLPSDSHNEVIILSLDSEALHAAANTWLTSWARDGIIPLRIGNAPVCAIRSGETFIAGTGPLPTTAPNYVFPVQTLLGSWELVAWDRTVTRVSYDFMTVAIAGFLALLIALMGIIAYLQQAQLLAETAERITFVNRVSHELRSPLTNILLNMELARELLPDLEDQPNRRLDLVQEEVHRLTRLVDNVLSFSANGNSGRQSVFCDPNEIMARLFEQFAPAFARRELVVTYHSSVTKRLSLNADAFVQIVGNLLSNVEKYVPGGMVVVTLSQSDSFISLTVTDHGPGVPANALDRIFLPFERLDHKGNEGVTGTGLGLSISRDLARQMGGDLRMIPSKAGATFELRIPLTSTYENTRR